MHVLLTRRVGHNHKVLDCLTCVQSYSNTDYVTEMQCVFRKQFSIGVHGHVPARKTLAWMKKFEETASALGAKHGAPRTVPADSEEGSF